MKELFYATHSKNKQNTMKERLKDLNIEVHFPDFDPNIAESGKNEIENAIIKATTFVNQVNIPILAGDSGLYFKDTNIESPGLVVRVSRNKPLTDSELVGHYQNLAKQNNGKITAYYKTGLALIVDGKIHTTEIIEPEFYILDKPCPNKHPDSPHSLAFSKKQNKYFNEMTPKEFSEEDKIFRQQLINFLKTWIDIK